MDPSIPSTQYVARELMQAPLMGSFIAFLLYGITCIQTLFYFQTYPKDHVSLKCMVSALWILETMHSAVNMYFINHYLIDNFGDIEALNVITWVISAGFEIGFITGLTVNLFFAFRIWRFTGNIWAASIVVLLHTARFALATAAVAIGQVYSESWEIFKDHVLNVLIATTSIGAVADSVSACILSYSLYQGRSGLRRTNHLINRLLVYTIASGGTTAMIDVVTLIAVLASPDTNLYLALVLVLEKIYANSALMWLNQRQFSRTTLRDPTSIALSDFRVAAPRETTEDLLVMVKSTSRDPSTVEVQAEVA